MDTQILDLLETGNAKLTITKPLAVYIAKLDLTKVHYRGEGDDVEQAMDALADDIAKLNKPQRTTRKQRGAALLESGAVSVNGRPGRFYVESQSGATRYTVDVKANECNCPDREHGHECKHLQAARSYNGLSIGERAKLLVENKAQWHGGESVTIWRAGTTTITVCNGGRERDQLLLEHARNGKRDTVQVGHLDPASGWIWQMSNGQYARWVARIDG